jgi:hypothetical protein
VTPVPLRAADAPADPNAWKLKIVVVEDEELGAHRFTVWLAPASDAGASTHLCIGSGPTRAHAIADADVELRGAVTLLANAEGS